jgi:hypothetical protein
LIRRDRPRQALDRLWWGLAAAVTAGIWGYWPYLRRENARLEPWEIAAIWSSEFMALLWFLRYGLDRLIQRCRGLDASRISRLSCRIVVIATGLGLGVDWVVTFRSRAIERQAFDRAAVAAGEVIACERDVDWFGLNRRYTLVCRFPDRNRVTHTVEFVLAGRETPPPLAQALAAGAFPMPLPIAYDLQNPGRSWVANLPLHRQDGNRIYQMSFLAVFFNTLLFANLALFASVLDWPEEMVPWLHSAPLFVITFLLWMGFLVDEVLRFATRRWWS